MKQLIRHLVWFGVSITFAIMWHSYAMTFIAGLWFSDVFDDVLSLVRK